METPDVTLSRLLERLVFLHQRAGKLAIACSGGLDSRFLTHAACLAGVTPDLYHVSGPHVSARETAACADWAQRHGLTLHIVTCDPLRLPEVLANTPDRCYACKRGLFSRLYREVGNACLCDGSNASDLQTYRPGLRALRELDIASPLADAGLEKSTVRLLAAQTGLENPDQPSRPCLLTRLDYGVRPSATLLSFLDTCEEVVERQLERLFPEATLPDFRIRRLLDDRLLLQISRPLTHDERSILTRRLAEKGCLELTIMDDAPVSGYFDQGTLSDSKKDNGHTSSGRI